MLSKSAALKHYKREDIQNALVSHTKDKEVAARFNDSFGSRPDSLRYNNDVLEFAKNGATSFHCSEELWENPLLIETGMRRSELDNLRKGWDLIVDVDCREWEYAKIISDMIVKIIKGFGIKTVGAKFSGNKGFHIGVPFEAFPVKVHGIETKDLFPEGPRRIAQYIVYLLEDKFLESVNKDYRSIAKEIGVEPEALICLKCVKCEGKIVQKKDYDYLCSSCGSQKQSEENRNYLACEKCGKIMQKQHLINICPYCKSRKFREKVDVARIIDVDTLLISSRHLYRAPYSLHEKSGLVSVPISHDQILEFDKEKAKPENIIEIMEFIPRTANSEEAAQLFMQAFDHTAKLGRSYVKTESKEFEIPAAAIPEDNFPACITALLKGGLEDGRKRSLFILINFLGSVGWPYDNLNLRLEKWNKSNNPPLRENYIQGQLRYSKNKKPILPPNCGNDSYYSSLGVVCNDCTKFKNPVNYAKWKWETSSKK